MLSKALLFQQLLPYGHSDPRTAHLLKALKVQMTEIRIAGTVSVAVTGQMLTQRAVLVTSLLAVLAKVLAAQHSVMRMIRSLFLNAQFCHHQPQMIRNQCVPTGHRLMVESSRSRATDSS